MTHAEQLMITFEQSQKTFCDQRYIENMAHDYAIKTEAPNCYDRTWTFYDGSKIVKTRDGLRVGV